MDRDQWLAQVREEILEPALPICCHRECKTPHLEELNVPHPSAYRREKNVDRD
jgi:hypothetical protein